MVTRLYAIYESFVERLITDWILLLPKLFPNYSELPKKIKETHQIGVAELLLELRKENSRFNYLSVGEVIGGLYDGITARKERYELLPDIFIRHDKNLRKEALEKIFANAGIQNTWSWIKKHREVNKFIEEILANENTAAGKLKELITYRNDAAHGSTINDILDSRTLLELCDFVEALCSALTELVTYKVLERRQSKDQVKNIGKITRWFNNPQAGRVKVNDCTLSVGDTLFLVSETKSYCQLVVLENIKIDETDKQQIEARGEIEIGVKFDVNAKDG